MNPINISEKLPTFASLINAYSKLLGTRNTCSKPKYDPFLDGDSDYYNTLIGEQIAAEMRAIFGAVKGQLR